MICVIYGTTGELIKLAPVLKRLRQSGIGYLSACTGQQVQQIPELLSLLDLPQPDLWLARGRNDHDLRANADVPGWLLATMTRFRRERPRLKAQLQAGDGKPMVLVQGDTMTTVIGALMGRRLRAQVAHIESGLRSFDLFNPFPEELDRRLSSRLADILYAPGAWAAGNLRRGTVINTGSNTIRDSLALASDDVPPGFPIPAGSFGLVSLHRFELLNRRQLLAETLEVLATHARTEPLLFVEHAVTMAAIERHRLSHLLDGPGWQRVPRLPFLRFVPLLRRSAFIVTDSGGNQEETFYLDIPCLVHRKRTERREGLGENVVLSGHDLAVLKDFLARPDRFHRKSPLPEGSPSTVIVDDLIARGYAVPPRAEHAGVIP
jgi:UDP-N-acetylglucosamine 2-epimerase (non-hydrolysing)